MNQHLSEQEKEAAIRNLQAAEKARIMAAYTADKRSLSTPELTQAYIFALQELNNPATNPAHLITLFHEIRASMPSCYGYFYFDVINEATALVKKEKIKPTMEAVEEFIDVIEHLPGEGPVVTHSERQVLRARG